MTRMIFVRHGESSGNMERRFYGHFDGKLTDKGRKQASLAAEFLREYSIDAAYASDLSRAYETGSIIAKPHNVDVVPDRELREIYAGKWENMLFSDIEKEYPQDYKVWMEDLWNSGPTGGERVMDVAKRVHDEVWKIALKNAGKTVLIATHATPIRTLACEWTGIDYSRISEVKWVKNASVSIVEYDTEKLITAPQILGLSSFLGEFTTGLPANV